MSHSESVTKIVEEQSDRIYDLYERKTKSFRQAFYSVGSLVLIFFLLVFYPYVSFRGEKYRIEDDLERLKKTIAPLRRLEKVHEELNRELADDEHEVVALFSNVRLTKLRAAEAEHGKKLRKLRTTLRDDAEAGAWAKGQESEPKLGSGFFQRHPTLQPIKQDGCFWLIGEEWIRCELPRHLQAMHETAAEPYAYKRISHERNTLLVPLHTSLTNLHQAFQKWLNGQAPGWQGDAKVNRSDLRRELDRFLNAYFDRIRDHRRSLVRGKSDLQNDIRKYEKERDEKSEELTRVIRRLDELKEFERINTPFGELPVGLNDLVLIFPALLAFGFLACSSILSESVRLRQVFHNLCQAKDPTREVLTDDHITLIAPLWIDPLEKKAMYVRKLMLLATPTIVFVTAIGLLLYNQLLVRDFIEEVRLPRVMYVCLYLLSCGLIVEGFRRIRNQMAGYDSEVNLQAESESITQSSSTDTSKT